MEESTKKLWLTKVKKGKVAVVESPYAPNNHNCIWLKQGTMYVYGNSGWEELSSSGGNTPEPEPEPLDPKYVRTPIEFVNFESKSITMKGNSLLFNFSDMISVQEEATEYQEGSKLTWKDSGGHESTVSDTPILINGDSTGDGAEMFSSMQQLLSVAYPNNTIELVSITDYRTYEASIVIAEVDGSRKTFIVEYFNEAPVEGQSYTMDPPAEPVIDESAFLKVFPQSTYPITGFIPAVFNKEEDDGNTYAVIGYYSKDNIYDNFETFWDDSYSYRPSIYGTDQNTIQGLNKVSYFWSYIFEDPGNYNPIIPAQQQYLLYTFMNYQVAITKDPEDLNKRILFIVEDSKNKWYEIVGQTNMSDEDILKDFFDVDNIDDIPSMYIDLYKRSNFG